MDGQTRKALLLGAGILLIAVSLAADAIGVGEGTRIGYKQLIGTVVGLGLALAGLFTGRSS